MHQLPLAFPPYVLYRQYEDHRRAMRSALKLTAEHYVMLHHNAVYIAPRSPAPATGDGKTNIPGRNDTDI